MKIYPDYNTVFNKGLVGDLAESSRIFSGNRKYECLPPFFLLRILCIMMSDQVRTNSFSKSDKIVACTCPTLAPHFLFLTHDAATSAGVGAVLLVGDGVLAHLEGGEERGHGVQALHRGRRTESSSASKEAPFIARAALQCHLEGLRVGRLRPFNLASCPLAFNKCQPLFFMPIHSFPLNCTSQELHAKKKTFCLDSRSVFPSPVLPLWPSSRRGPCASTAPWRRGAGPRRRTRRRRCRCRLRRPPARRAPARGP